MKKMIHLKKQVAFSALLSLCLATDAQADDSKFAHCAKKFHDNAAARLACYDLAASPPPAATVPQSVETIVEKPAPPDLERSYLTRLWNLDDEPSHDESRLGRLVPHRQSYMLARKTSNANNLPASPAAGHSVTVPSSLDALETKYQLSFKADIGSQHDINFWGLKTLRLWGAYTQQSNWQMFNTRNSSPFRETNYEPELIATFGTEGSTALKLVNLGFAHQSNGQHLPESRSWNRLYLQGGFEWGNTSLMARGWWRIPENILKDDNPDISNYLGRADLTGRWEAADKSQSLGLLLRNNLNWPNNRSFVQLDWSMPVALGNSARLHTQITSGFGESMIDYNHRQNTIGLGFSFREW